MPHALSWLIGRLSLCITIRTDFRKSPAMLDFAALDASCSPKLSLNRSVALNGSDRRVGDVEADEVKAATDR